MAKFLWPDLPEVFGRSFLHYTAKQKKLNLAFCMGGNEKEKALALPAAVLVLACLPMTAAEAKAEGGTGLLTIKEDGKTCELSININASENTCAFQITDLCYNLIDILMPICSMRSLSYLPEISPKA